MAKIDTSVGKLVDMIKDGDLRLPEMQRRYVWPATRVRDLLDSLYRGYPSGTILVWETDKEMPSRNLDIAQQTGVWKGHRLLLDGQQRLTSLSAVLRGEPVKVKWRRRPIEILFNLDHPEGPPVEVLEVEDEQPEDANDTEGDDQDNDTEDGPTLQERLKQRTFVVASRALLSDAKWVPVAEIFDQSQGDLQILRKRGLITGADDATIDRYSRRLQAVRKIRDYPYVMHVLDKELSYEEVAEIFVRVNSLGTKLRSSDLALAQITSRWPNSLGLFESFQEECEEKWFTLDLGLIVRALVVFTTHQSRFKTAGTIAVDDLKDGWKLAQDGLRYAINYMRSNLGIEDESLLSSPLFLIAIGYLAQKLNYRISAIEDADLRKWFYIANARGHYSASSETKLDSELRGIKNGGSASMLLDALRQQFGRLEIQPGDLVGKGQRSALLSTAYLALKAKGAKDWRTRLALSLTHSGRYHFIEYHHVFPRAQLNAAGGYEKSEVNEIANMAFVTGGTNRKMGSTPAERTLADVLKDQGELALKAHCIPLDTELWKLENYRAFLEYRRAALANAINEFVAGAGADQVALDVDALVAAGESDMVEFKSSARWDYKLEKPNEVIEQNIVKAVAALMNGKGGTLLIGVADDGQGLGLDLDLKTLGKKPDRDGYQQFLVHLIANNIGKAACAELSISFHPLQGKEICAVRIPAASAPAYLQIGGDKKLFVRLGNTSQELNGPQAVDYARQRWPKV